MSISSRISAIEQHIEDDYSVLTLGGADLTNVDKNILNLKPQWQERLLHYINNGTQEVWDNWEKVSASNVSSASLNNTVEAPMKLDLKGNTYQEENPTPDNPKDIHIVSGDNSIKVEGKNLTNYSNWEQGNFYVEGANINNNVASQNVIRMIDFITVKPSTTYTLSCNTTIGQFGYIFKDTSGNMTGAFDIPNTTYYTFTTPANVKQIRLRIGNSSYPKTYGTDYNIQLEEGNQATTYTPYVSQTYEIDLRTSKNLFDISTITRGYELNSNTGGIQVNANWWLSDYIGIKPNTDYTSSHISSLTKCWYDSDKNFISKVQSTTGTSPSNARYLRVNGTLASIESNPNLMIEEGDTATTYEAYNSIELCKIGDYQDRIFKAIEGDSFYDTLDSATKQTLDTGSWYLYKEFKKYYLKDLTFTPSQIGSTGFYRQLSDESLSDIKRPSSNGETIQMLCSHYVKKSANQTYNKNIGISISQGDKIYIYDENYNNSTNDYNTWVQNNNPYFIGKLATPTYTKITGDLISQLEAVKKSYNEVTNISQTPNDLPFILDITALKEI